MQQAAGEEGERKRGRRRGREGGMAQSKAVMNYFGFGVDLALNLLFSALENSLHDETATRKLKGF